MDEKEQKIKKLKKANKGLIIAIILISIVALYFVFETIAWKDMSAEYCELTNEAVDTLNVVIEMNYAEYPDIQKLTKLNCPDRILKGGYDE